jgi:hypothetical protein
LASGSVELCEEITQFGWVDPDDVALTAGAGKRYSRQHLTLSRAMRGVVVGVPAHQSIFSSLERRA